MADPSTKSTKSNRPYWVTLVGAVVSIAVSVAGVVYNYQKFDADRDNQRLAQRAYLVIRNGQGRLSQMPTGFMDEKEPGSKLAVTYGFDIKNIGKTPASITDYSVTFGVPREWQLLNDVPYRRRELTEIAQDDAFRVSGAMGVFRLSDADFLGYRLKLEQDIIPLVTVEGHLTYRDVFNGEHTTEWCWKVGEGSPFQPCDENP